MNLSEEQRKRWALKYMLWAFDEMDLEEFADEWTPTQRMNFLIKRANNFNDKQVVVLTEDLQKALEAIDTMIGE